MLKLLIKLFIKDSDNICDPKVRSAYGKLCGIYGIVINLLLFAGKYFAGFLSGSIAIIADAFNNLSDAGSSLISFFGFALAEKQPDSDHPYGHGRIEYLVGLLLSALIILMGFELMKDSLSKIATPQPIQPGLLPAMILVFSILGKFYMALYNRGIGKKINSAAMLATAADSLSDCVSTLVVFAAMGVQHFFNINIDAWAGLAVALFIMFAGVRAAGDTISPLLGQAPDKELVRCIEETVMAYPEVVGIHDLVVHDYGPGRLMISLHAEVRGDMDIFTVHDAIDSAENVIKERFGAITTIHMDPIEADNNEVSTMKSAVLKRLQEVDKQISIHDFRMVPGPTHTNLIFDAAVPSTHPISDKELKELIKDTINGTWPDRYAVVTIDRIYL